MTNTSNDISPTTVWMLLLVGLLGVIAVHIPWHVHDVAAFSLNAFDLAEWVSLHPATRAENPALLSSILLRLPLVLLGISITLSANFLRDERLRWIWRCVALLVVFRLNPPIDFYRSPNGVSLNEQHLAYLTYAGIGLVLLIIAIGRRIRPFYFPLMTILWIVMVVASWEGLSRATRTIESLQIDVDYGA
ncbi:MAG: hypothetical protein L0154_08955, partial [Chloroflexi bacterium]|nr:hypothetical protein [Chloroflexota bacterium]